MRARKRNPGQSDWLARIHGDETCRFDAMAASPQRGARASLKRARNLPEPTRLVGKDASQANRRTEFSWIFGPGRNPRRRLHRKLNLFRKGRRGGALAGRGLGIYLHFYFYFIFIVDFFISIAPPTPPGP